MTAVLPPLFLQVGLTIVLVLLLGSLRTIESLTNSEVKAQMRKGRSDMYGRTAILLSDNFKNQFEIPVLFYAAVLLAVSSGPVSDWFVTLAWVFAISRLVHTLIHCTVNIIIARFLVFAVGLTAVALMWIDLYGKLLGA